MAKLTRDDILKLAKLSRLKLSDDEIERFEVELSAILEYVDQLQSIDTDKVQATSQVTGLENVTRADEVRDYGATPTDLLQNSPDQTDNFIKVKKIL